MLKQIRRKPLASRAIFFDLSFYILGFYTFYNSALLIGLSVVCIVLHVFFTDKYTKDQTHYQSRQFIDFLNYIHSNLSTGMTFEHAILAFEKDPFAHSSNQLRTCFDQLCKSIKIGVFRSELLEVLYSHFPISDTKTFNNMLLQSMTSGANQSYIVSITLDKLYIKHTTESEIQMILYQKSLEQLILCLAPFGIIHLIRSVSPEYLDVMYSSLLGLTIMTFAFSLIVIMKLVSSKIIKIDV